MHSSGSSLLEEVPAQAAAALKLGPLANVVGAPVRLDLEHFHADAITTARWLLGARLVRVLPDGRRLSGGSLLVCLVRDGPSRREFPVVSYQSVPPLTPGRIVECEAFLGVHDAAAHSLRAKRTAKNDVMYKAGGHACTWLVPRPVLVGGGSSDWVGWNAQTTHPAPLESSTITTASITWIIDVYQCHRYFCMNVICGREEEPTGVLIRALEPEEGLEEMIEHWDTPLQPRECLNAVGWVWLPLGPLMLKHVAPVLIYTQTCPERRRAAAAGR